jgi:hypothetical protein
VTACGLEAAGNARHPFLLRKRAFLMGERKLPMTDNKERELESQLREIDLRRSQLEIVLGTLPPSTPLRYDFRREELETELRGLWSLRSSLTKRPRAA